MKPDSLTQLLDVHLFMLGETPITPGMLLIVFGVVVASFVISALVQGALRRILARTGRDAVGSLGVATRLLHYAIIAIGLTVALQTAGVKLTALFAAGAVFAVGVGFAMQNLAQNFVSGVLLLLEHSVKPGDIIELEGLVVRIRSMGFRTTVVRTLDDEDMIVPNATLVQNTVKNFTYRDPSFRLRVTVGVSYASDMTLVRQVLAGVGERADFRIESVQPSVLLTGFGSSSVDWELGVWIDNPWAQRIYASNLRQAIWDAFIQRGITIAFPQVDVHFDDKFTRALSGKPPAPPS